MLLLWWMLTAQAGSYGAATAEFPGFRASVDASVGAWSDPVAEGEAYQRLIEAGRKTLADHDAMLRAAYERYIKGAHRYERLRGHLVPWTDTAPTLWTRLSVGDPMWGYQQIDLRIALDAALGDPLEEKLGADFALAQIGATLPEPPSRAADPRQASLLQGQLGANAIIGVNGRDLHGLLMIARQSEPELRVIAASAEPLAPQPGADTYARPGWCLARVLVAVFDGRSPRQGLPDVSALPDDTRYNVLRMTALMLPDDDLAAGAREIAEIAGPLTSRGGPLGEWLPLIAR